MWCYIECVLHASADNSEELPDVMPVDDIAVATVHAQVCGKDIVSVLNTWSGVRLLHLAVFNARPRPLYRLQIMDPSLMTDNCYLVTKFYIYKTIFEN